AFTFPADVRKIDLREFDIILVNFEPVVAQKALLQRRKTVGISHQYSFLYKVPCDAFRRAGLYAWAKGFAPVSTPIGMHWDSFGHSRILPPMVRTPERAAEADPYKVAVYMPWEDPDVLVDFFKYFRQYRFHVFSPQVETRREVGNVILNPLSATGGF